MSRLFLAFFAILAIFSATTMAKPSPCGQDEVWKSCGTACPPSCDDPSPICTLQCVEGCQCKDGWLRNKAGECVPPNKCC